MESSEISSAAQCRIHIFCHLAMGECRQWKPAISNVNVVSVEVKVSSNLNLVMA